MWLLMISVNEIKFSRYVHFFAHVSLQPSVAVAAPFSTWFFHDSLKPLVRSVLDLK